MVKRIQFIVVLMLWLAAWTGWADGPRTCKWTFRISGDRVNGDGPMDTDMTVTQRCYDFDAAGLASRLAADRALYAGYTYTPIEGEGPTQRRDCAGTAFQKLFGKGPFWIDAGNFFDHVLLWFGKKIYDPNVRSSTWADVKAGDILIYRKGGVAQHITWVREVTTVAGVTARIWIETKDGEQGTYLHPISIIDWPNDPLTLLWGDIYIYRVDTAHVKAEFVSKTCGCGEVPPPGAKAEEEKGGEDLASADVPKAEGKGPSPASSEERWEGRWKGREKATVYMDGIDPVVREAEGEFRIEDLGAGIRLTDTGGKTSVLKKLKSNPNAAMRKTEKTEPIPQAIASMGATGETTFIETLVLFLREGRLYLTHRILTNGRIIMTIGEEKKETRTKSTNDAIGIYDRVK